MKEEELTLAYANQPTPKTPEEKRKQLIRDPAIGVAVAKCLINRIMGTSKLGKVRNHHPAPCRFCKYETGTLKSLHAEWMDYSQLDVDHGVVPGIVQAFMSLDPERSAALVREAQGYGTTDGVPEGAASADGDRKEGDGDVLEGGRTNGAPADPSPPPGGSPGWAVGGVRAPRQQRRRT